MELITFGLTGNSFIFHDSSQSIMGDCKCEYKLKSYPIERPLRPKKQSFKEITKPDICRMKSCK